MPGPRRTDRPDALGVHCRQRVRVEQPAIHVCHPPLGAGQGGLVCFLAPREEDASAIRAPHGLERHFAECPACAELARDSAAAVAFMSRVADVEPSPELITRILFDPPWNKEKPRSKSFDKRLAGWFSPILQPKFAMGAAMTILSFSLLSQMAPVRQLRMSDLEPAKVWNGLTDRIDRVKYRSQMFIESLKFVYQIQTTLAG